MPQAYFQDDNITGPDSVRTCPPNKAQWPTSIQLVLSAMPRQGQHRIQLGPHLLLPLTNHCCSACHLAQGLARAGCCSAVVPSGAAWPAAASIPPHAVGASSCLHCSNLCVVRAGLMSHRSHNALQIGRPSCMTAAAAQAAVAAWEGKWGLCR